MNDCFWFYFVEKLIGGSISGSPWVVTFSAQPLVTAFTAIYAVQGGSLRCFDVMQAQLARRI
jgi:hypothetical protein